jgi:RNA polymerase sigma-70 factor (sigma-E family)
MRPGIEEVLMASESAFESFVRDRGPALHRYGYVLTGSAHDADDLVQEALIRLRGAWTRVERQNDPTGFVRTTMARLHISSWRRRRREWLTAIVPDRALPDVAPDQVAASEADQIMWRALGALPPRQRAVIVLRFYEHLTDNEIAETLGVSKGTIRSQASRALDKLRQMPALSSNARGSDELRR